jgi:hypothetical protein
MRNTRTVCADWRMLYADDGSLAIGLLPHDDSEALILTWAKLVRIAAGDIGKRVAEVVG